VIRLRPDDDYFLCLHSPSTPMQIGALQLFDVPDGDRAGFADAVRNHFRERIPATALSCVRRSPPWHVDCDAWFARARVDIDLVTSVHDVGSPVSLGDLHGLVATWAMQQIDADGPPFRVVIVPTIAEGGSALFLATLHALADGVGFQSIVETLTDAAVTPEHRPLLVERDERVPTAPEWLGRCALALTADGWTRLRSRRTREASEHALEAFKADPAHKRAKTPTFLLSSPTSGTRSYSTVSLPIEWLRRVGHAFDATVNDVFLVVGSGAVRRYLLSIDALPDTPIVVNAARSYRRAEHGDRGNRIVSLHPHLATTLADPIERLRAIQASMVSELERSRLQEPLMDQGARPFSARKLRRQMADRVGSGGAVLPGNVSLSNVPGPTEPRYLAGYAMRASYPAPILGAGRFLNITLRRYVDHLDLGIMCDAAKIPDANVMRGHVIGALDELMALA
jgi:diacylglycerol O-acyltransferase / wax synthase